MSSDPGSDNFSGQARAGIAPQRDAPLLPFVTLILWLSCLSAGVAGLCIPYPRPRPAAAPAMESQLIKVELPTKPPPPPEVQPPTPQPAPSPAELALPDAPPSPDLPPAPPVTPVAAPGAAISFAVPVAGLTRIVDIDQAAHGQVARVATTASAGSGTGRAAVAPVPRPAIAPPAPPPVTRLTFGEGAGRQPPPEYPREAVTAHQQGTVTLRFSVDETGHVVSVDVIAPSRWPLLNQAASRTVRDSWHFPPGEKRIFEVPIEFQLQ